MCMKRLLGLLSTFIRRCHAATKTWNGFNLSFSANMKENKQEKLRTKGNFNLKKSVKMYTKTDERKHIKCAGEQLYYFTKRKCKIRPGSVKALMLN